MDLQPLFELSKRIVSIEGRLERIEKAILNQPEWISVDSVAVSSGLGKQSVIKQLYSGLYEDGKDYQKFNGKIYIQNWPHRASSERGLNNANGQRLLRGRRNTLRKRNDRGQADKGKRRQEGE